MGAENCSCRRGCSDLNSNLDLSREANPVYDQFYRGLNLNINVGKFEGSEDGNFEVFNFNRKDQEDSANVRLMIENPHAPSSATAKYILNVPDYRSVQVEEATAKYGRGGQS
jgi:hypothetical protein